MHSFPRSSTPFLQHSLTSVVDGDNAGSYIWNPNLHEDEPGQTWNVSSEIMGRTSGRVAAILSEPGNELIIEGFSNTAVDDLLAVLHSELEPLEEGTQIKQALRVVALSKYMDCTVAMEEHLRDFWTDKTMPEVSEEFDDICDLMYEAYLFCQTDIFSCASRALIKRSTGPIYDAQGLLPQGIWG